MLKTMILCVSIMLGYSACLNAHLSGSHTAAVTVHEVDPADS